MYLSVFFISTKVACQPGQSAKIVFYLDARVVSAELAVNSSFSHHAAFALASTHLSVTLRGSLGKAKEDFVQR